MATGQANGGAALGLLSVYRGRQCAGQAGLQEEEEEERAAADPWVCRTPHACCLPCAVLTSCP